MSTACPSPLITVIGRGHSGTRALSHTLSASGVYMGAEINDSGDLVPAEDLYEACRIMAGHVRHLGGLRWDFTALHTMPIDPAFERLVLRYLASVLDSSAPLRGWKLPETTLVYPWIVRMFPDNRYIHWIRDPRDCILGRHLTDDLADFGVPYDPVDDDYTRRAISWKYQVEIVRATPPPHRVLKVRFEDFVLEHETVLRRIEDFTGIPLARIPVRPESIGRWKTSDRPRAFDLFTEDLAANGYTQEDPR